MFFLLDMLHTLSVAFKSLALTIHNGSNSKRTLKQEKEGNVNNSHSTVLENQKNSLESVVLQKNKT